MDRVTQSAMSSAVLPPSPSVGGTEAPARTRGPGTGEEATGNQGGEGGGKPKCLHCRERPRGFFRGLCVRCYNRSDVRGQYPPEPPLRGLRGAYHPRRHNRKGLPPPGFGDDEEEGERPPPVGDRRLPASPTDAVPGSSEKIAVMEERAARGEAIFHPDDLTGG
jgi:hypothetical protein